MAADTSNAVPLRRAAGLEGPCCPHRGSEQQENNYAPGGPGSSVPRWSRGRGTRPSSLAVEQLGSPVLTGPTMEKDVQDLLAIRYQLLKKKGAGPAQIMEPI